MCKKLISLILTLMISLSVCACGFSDKDMDIYEKIHKKYLKMESYSADLDMTVFSNKTQNRYFISQKTCDPDKFYTLVTDPDGLFSVTTVTSGPQTLVTTDGSDYSITVPSNEYLDLLFVNNFLKAYYASETTSLSVDTSFIEGNKTTLSVETNHENSAIKKVSLSFNNETLAPEAISVFGENDTLLSTAKYENFKFNDNIDPSVFITD